MLPIRLQTQIRADERTIDQRNRQAIPQPMQPLFPGKCQPHADGDTDEVVGAEVEKGPSELFAPRAQDAGCDGRVAVEYLEEGDERDDPCDEFDDFFVVVE